MVPEVGLYPGLRELATQERMPRSVPSQDEAWKFLAPA